MQQCKPDPVKTPLTLFSFLFAVVLCATLECPVLAAGHAAQPAIPEARFRVLYTGSNAPVKWIAVEVECLRKLGWLESRRKGEDYEKTLSSFQFYATEDGWVTLPPMQAPGTTEYEIKIWAPASGFIDYPYDYSGGKASWPFNEMTLPRFLKMPEEKRVLYATYTNDLHWGPLLQQQSYEGIQYTLETERIFFAEWPKMFTDYWGETLPWQTGAGDALFKFTPPYYQEYYFYCVFNDLYWMLSNISSYEASALKEQNETAKATIRLRTAELRALLRDILCADFAKKKLQWGSFHPPSKLLDTDFLRQADCDALQKFYRKTP